MGCCAPDSEGAQELSSEAGRCSRACWSIAHTIWKGMWSVKLLGLGCMTAQMLYELEHNKELLLDGQKSRGLPGMDEDGGVFEDEYNSAYLKGSLVGGAPVKSRGAPMTESMDRGLPSTRQQQTEPQTIQTRGMPPLETPEIEMQNSPHLLDKAPTNEENNDDGVQTSSLFDDPNDKPKKKKKKKKTKSAEAVVDDAGEVEDLKPKKRKKKKREGAEDRS